MAFVIYHAKGLFTTGNPSDSIKHQLLDFWIGISSKMIAYRFVGQQERILIPKVCTSSEVSLRSLALLSTKKETKGGSSETETNELAVIPTSISALSLAVIIVTPVEKLLATFFKTVLLISISI